MRIKSFKVAIGGLIPLDFEGYCKTQGEYQLEVAFDVDDWFNKTFRNTTHTISFSVDKGTFSSNFKYFSAFLLDFPTVDYVDNDATHTSSSIKIANFCAADSNYVMGRFTLRSGAEATKLTVYCDNQPVATVDLPAPPQEQTSSNNNNNEDALKVILNFSPVEPLKIHCDEKDHKTTFSCSVDNELLAKQPKGSKQQVTFLITNKQNLNSLILVAGGNSNE